MRVVHQIHEHHFVRVEERHPQSRVGRVVDVLVRDACKRRGGEVQLEVVEVVGRRVAAHLPHQRDGGVGRVGHGDREACARGQVRRCEVHALDQGACGREAQVKQLEAQVAVDGTVVGVGFLEGLVLVDDAWQEVVLQEHDRVVLLRPNVVPPRHVRAHGGEHARLLALSEHVGAVGIVHVVLDVVLRPARRRLEVAACVADGVGRVVHPVVVGASGGAGVVRFVAPGVLQVGPVAHLVRQNLVVRPHRGLGPPHGPVGRHDAVIHRGGALHVPGVEGERRAVSAIRRIHHPHVQVHGGVPLDHLLERQVAPVVGEVALDAVDAGGGLSVGVEVGQTKLHPHVRHQPREVGMHVWQLGVGRREVFVQLHDGLVNLRVGDVLRPVVVHHVKHNRHHDVLGGARRLTVCVLVGEVFQGDAPRLLALDPLRVRPMHLVQLFLVLAAVLRMHLHSKHQGGKGEEEVLHGEFSWVSKDTARPPAIVSVGPCQMDTSCASRLGPIISP